MIKEYIDGILLNDEKMQVFLEWANQKTNSVKFSYKKVAVRAFYAAIEAFGGDLIISDLINDSDFTLTHAHELIRARVLRITLDLSHALDHELAQDRHLDYDLALDQNLARPLDLVLGIFLALDLKLVSLDNEVLRQLLQEIRSKLPTDPERFDQWWENNGEGWIHELKQVSIDHRNIGHNWQFTKEQSELLEQYYAANLLLVECMNRSDVSEQVRKEIESTLLLPISSIPNTEL